MNAYTIVMPPESGDVRHQPPSDYPRILHASLMIAQLIFGAVCIGIIADMGSYQSEAVLADTKFTVNAFISFAESTALLMVGYGCLCTTFLLLLSSLISIRTFYHVPKSLFFVLYHLISASLYLSTGLSVVIHGYQRRYEQTYITAGALGIVNSVLYLFSTALGLRALQSSK